MNLSISVYSKAYLIHRNEALGTTISPFTEGRDDVEDEDVGVTQGWNERDATTLRKKGGNDDLVVGGGGGGRREAEVNEEGMRLYTDGGYDFRLNEAPILNATGMYSNVSVVCLLYFIRFYFNFDFNLILVTDDLIIKQRCAAVSCLGCEMTSLMHSSTPPPIHFLLPPLLV